MYIYIYICAYIHIYIIILYYIILYYIIHIYIYIYIIYNTYIQCILNSGAESTLSTTVPSGNSWDPPTGCQSPIFLTGTYGYGTSVNHWNLWMLIPQLRWILAMAMWSSMYTCISVKGFLLIIASIAKWAISWTLLLAEASGLAEASSPKSGLSWRSHHKELGLVMMVIIVIVIIIMIMMRNRRTIIMIVMMIIIIIMILNLILMMLDDGWWLLRLLTAWKSSHLTHPELFTTVDLKGPNGSHLFRMWMVSSVLNFNSWSLGSLGSHHGFSSQKNHPTYGSHPDGSLIIATVSPETLFTSHHVKLGYGPHIRTFSIGDFIVLPDDKEINCSRRTPWQQPSWPNQPALPALTQSAGSLKNEVARTDVLEGIILGIPISNQAVLAAGQQTHKKRWEKNGR